MTRDELVHVVIVSPDTETASSVYARERDVLAELAELARSLRPGTTLHAILLCGTDWYGRVS